MRDGKKASLGRVQMPVPNIPGIAPCLVKISLTHLLILKPRFSQKLVQVGFLYFATKKGYD